MRRLVHAAAGGVGRHLAALAKHRGAEVFATVGPEEKARIAASLGADHEPPRESRRLHSRQARKHPLDRHNQTLGR